MDVYTEEMERKNIMTILYREANNLKTLIGKLKILKKQFKIFFYCVSAKPYQNTLLCVVGIPFLWYFKTLV